MVKKKIIAYSKLTKKAGRKGLKKGERGRRRRRRQGGRGREDEPWKASLVSLSKLVLLISNWLKDPNCGAGWVTLALIFSHSANCIKEAAIKAQRKS